MALRDPRYTKFRLRWHSDPAPDGTPRWWCDMGGVRVAEAAKTGTHLDDYPWDWYLTDAGQGMKVGKGWGGGTADTLRSVKDSVDALLRPLSSV